MIDITEIIETTGNTYLPKQGNRITDLLTNKVIESGNYRLINDETGKNSRLAAQDQRNYIQDTLPYRLLAGTTGADTSGCQELLILIGTEVVSHNSITNASFFVNKTVPTRKAKEPPKTVSLHSSQELSLPRKKYEIMDLANSLRESSGLDIESLAQIFKVSRATYHRWLRGLPVSKRHYNYILEIRPLLEEAAQRLGSPEAVNTWLLTPTSSGGKKPIEYLAEKNYDLFRGFLLHQRTGNELFRPLKPSRRIFKPRKREEIEDVREQLRPHTWYNEDNDPSSSNE